MKNMKQDSNSEKIKDPEKGLKKDLNLGNDKFRKVGTN